LPGWLSLPLHHARMNEAAVVTQHHDRENGPWLSHHHDLPPPPPRHGDLGFGLGSPPPHLPIRFSSELCQPWTSRCTPVPARRVRRRGGEGRCGDKMRRVGPFGTGGGELLAGDEASFASLAGEQGDRGKFWRGEGEERAGARDPARGGEVRRRVVQRVCSASVHRLLGLWERDTPSTRETTRASSTQPRGGFFAK
jgi:hypothetical protein